MSFQSTVLMAASQSLQARMVAAAAASGSDDPQGFVRDNLWHILSGDANWAAAWEYAKANETVNVNPDTGMRDDVITDAMIQNEVQARMTELATPPA